MKIRCFICTLALTAHFLYGQKHDYVWVTGDDNQLLDTTYGGSTIDFNFNPVNVYFNYRELNMYVCNSSICDTAGNLMFYTNGCDIAGADDVIIENGEGINPGQVHQIKCDQENTGYTSGYQSSIILPLPGSNHLYYLFHKRIIYTSNPFSVKTDKLLYTIVDMAENNGKGKVIAKNIELMADSLSYGELTAVKHANGKDWWLVTPKEASNTFYVFLFTDQGITDTIKQSIGISPALNASGGIQVSFSPDGTKMFRTNPKKPVQFYGFDRSIGLFDSYDSITVNYSNYPNPVTTWCAISPNNHYLYVTTSIYVFQFDLWSSDISASQKTVAEWDGFKDPIGTTFGFCQLAPDCKIYVSTIDAKYYHVINNPDEEGTNCQVTQHSFIFPTPTGASIPSFPNYRLGPIDNPGLPCTTTVGSQQVATAQGSVLEVYPNPASDYLNITANHPLPTGGRWVLSDAQGRILHTELLSERSTCMEIPLQSLPPGVYFWHLQSKEGAVISGGKMVKMRY